MHKKIRILGRMLLILSFLLGACSAGSTPSSINSPVPSTGATSTPPASIQGSLTSTVTSSSTQAAADPGSTAVSTISSGSSSTAVTYILDPSKSEASYTVREQLARLNLPSDAVGKTNQVSGQISINPDGSIDQNNSKFSVDLLSLATDSNMRDNFVRRNLLQTSQFPQAVFVPTQISGLPSPLPQSGSVKFKINGNLSIHGVSKPVTWDVSANANNGEVTGTATTSFTFEDFGISQPQVPVVLSVVDKINLNINFDLVKK